MRLYIIFLAYMILAMFVMEPAKASYIIPNGSVTKVKLSPLYGQVLGSECSPVCTRTSATYASTGMTATITTTGRPVFVTLVTDVAVAGTSSVEASCTSGGPCQMCIKVIRDSSVKINEDCVGGGNSSFTTVPVSSFQVTDLTAAAGSHTYDVQYAVVLGTGTIFIANAKVLVYEL